MTNRKRKGISPIIATVLLIAITIAAGLAIYGWVSGLIGAGTNNHMPTSEIATVTVVDVTSTTATLQITNEGNFPIPIYDSNVTVEQSNTGTMTGTVSISPTPPTEIPARGTVTVSISRLSAGTTYTVTLVGLIDTNGDPVISGSISFTTPS